jgi:hypothetical protein
MQKFLTDVLKVQLIKNGIAQKAARDASDGEKDIDFKPVVKFFNPCGAATWLISEISPDNPDLMFGLCDLGMQCPELGDVSIREMLDIKLPLGLKIERDYHFRADKTLSAYADAAREAGSIQA